MQYFRLTTAQSRRADEMDDDSFLLTPSHDMSKGQIRREAQKADARRQHDDARRQHDDALWQSRLERLPSQADLTKHLREAMRPYLMPSMAAKKRRHETLHPDPTAAVSISELYLEQLMIPGWPTAEPAGACFEVLMAHTLPCFSNPAEVDFRLLMEPSMLNLFLPSSSSQPAHIIMGHAWNWLSGQTAPPSQPPADIVAYVRNWLSVLHLDTAFAQRRDGVIVRRGLIMSLRTLFSKSQSEYDQPAPDDPDVARRLRSRGIDLQLLQGNVWEGHQILLLCELPPATDSDDNYDEAAQMRIASPFPPSHPSTRIKFTIVDNIASQSYFWPVHGWLIQAFQEAQLEVWPTAPRFGAEATGWTCQFETIQNLLHVSERLCTTCMATSFRAALIASLLVDPTAKLQRKELPSEGLRFATLIKLHLYRMRCFLLTDAGIWSPHNPHAVFVASNGMDAHALDRPCMWLAPLRGVPLELDKRSIAHWLFNTSDIADRTYPIYFEPTLSRLPGFTNQRRAGSTSVDSCITMAQFKT